MKIEPGSWIPPAGSSNKNAPKPAASPAASGADQDQVALSAEALQAADAAEDATVETREQRVERLRAGIEAGTYRPDAQAIAERLIEQALRESKK